MKPILAGLVGDVGGTNARLALIDSEGRVKGLHVFPAAEYNSLSDVIADYLERTLGRNKRLPRAVIAVAGPVVDGEMEFTNLDWQVSEGEILAQFEFEAVRLINDFAAQALACPMLSGEALRPIGPALRGAPNAPMVVLGGRAPALRWGMGSLQEIDHVPFVAPLCRYAATAQSAAAVGDRIDDRCGPPSGCPRGWRSSTSRWTTSSARPPTAANRARSPSCRRSPAPMATSWTGRWRYCPPRSAR